MMIFLNCLDSFTCNESKKTGLINPHGLLNKLWSGNDGVSQGYRITDQMHQRKKTSTRERGRGRERRRGREGGQKRGGEQREKISEIDRERRRERDTGERDTGERERERERSSKQVTGHICGISAYDAQDIRYREPSKRGHTWHDTVAVPQLHLANPWQLQSTRVRRYLPERARRADKNSTNFSILPLQRQTNIT
jgi:hypothetical protein